jgi:L-ascorbate metabolism protein UlaG (beta-lactamase superfamily)
MRIEYVSHATLLVDTGDLKILTDPWFRGPAYAGQWNVFPKPVNTDIAHQADVILLSHGHEDHLHEPTLRELPRTARVFYPYTWYGGMKDFLGGMSFGSVEEAGNRRTYELTPKTSVTFLTVGLDSVIVIESDGKVFVNVNDALHATDPSTIRMYARYIKERWPRIDTVFCGFGGASYFPNTLRLPAKDDRSVAEAREQFFAYNFCRIVAALGPQVAVPFAADFVLLRRVQRWINESRFPRERMSDYYARNFGQKQPVTVHSMYSGDVLDDNALIRASPYRAQMREGSLDHLIETQYGEGIKEAEATVTLTEESAEELASEILANVTARAAVYPPAEPLRFCVRVTDVADRNCYLVVVGDGVPGVTRAAAPTSSCVLTVETSSKVLRCSFGSEWGGDAITIGYGADIYLDDVSVAERRIDIAVIRLLTRHPQASRQLRIETIRGLKFMAENGLMMGAIKSMVAGPVRRLLPRKKTALLTAPNRSYGAHWLTRTKCEICQICDFPLIDDVARAAEAKLGTDRDSESASRRRMVSQS